MKLEAVKEAILRALRILEYLGGIETCLPQLCVPFMLLAILEYLGGIETKICRAFGMYGFEILEYLGGIETTNKERYHSIFLNRILEYLGGIETNSHTLYNKALFCDFRIPRRD